MNPALADDSYQCDRCFGHPSRCDCPDGPTFDVVHIMTPPTTTKEPEMTADPFAPPSDIRTTEWSKYPLPPRAPRFQPQFNGNRQYLLPDPTTGLPTGYSRATTVADTLDDKSGLAKWKERTKIASVVLLIDSALGFKLDDLVRDEEKRNPSIQLAAALLKELRRSIADGNGQRTNNVADHIDAYNGGRDSAEFGTAVHEWLEALDIGLVTLWQIPEQFRPWAIAYQDALRRAGFVAVPIYVERVVMYDSGAEVITGTLDRIYRCVTTGELYLGDLKTSKADNLKFSWLSYAVQLTVYGRASKMMTTDGTAWEPMPPLNPDMALLVHVPSDKPAASMAIPYNLRTGDQYLATSIVARDHRRNAKHDVPNQTTPVPSAAALRFIAAYQAIQNSGSVDDLNRIWGEYQDVWTDELTALGHTTAQLYPVNATT